MRRIRKYLPIRAANLFLLQIFVCLAHTEAACDLLFNDPEQTLFTVSWSESINCRDLKKNQ